MSDMLCGKWQGHFHAALASVAGEGEGAEGGGKAADIRLAYAQWLARSPGRHEDAITQYRSVRTAQDDLIHGKPWVSAILRDW
jgi:hypothetical protein